jgi:hypothetical protein
MKVKGERGSSEVSGDVATAMDTLLCHCGDRAGRAAALEALQRTHARITEWEDARAAKEAATNG